MPFSILCGLICSVTSDSCCSLYTGNAVQSLQPKCGKGSVSCVPSYKALPQRSHWPLQIVWYCQAFTMSSLSLSDSHCCKPQAKSIHNKMFLETKLLYRSFSLSESTSVCVFTYAAVTASLCWSFVCILWLNVVHLLCLCPYGRNWTRHATVDLESANTFTE